MGNGLIDLDAAAFWTGRSRESLRSLHRRNKLTGHGYDEAGRLLLSFEQVCKLGAAEEPTPGRPAQLLAA